VTEISTCPTCGRRPSQGTNASIRFYGAEGCDIEEEGCPDPIHDLADQGPALKAECDEARKRLQDARAELFTERENTARCVATIARLAAERDEARALVMELFQRLCGEWEHHDQGTEVRWLYDHMASSTLREAQAALVAWGRVKREECVRE